MDVEELTAALTRHEPDPDAVLASFRAKRQARRRLIRGRIMATTTSILVAVVVVGLIGILRHSAASGASSAGGCGYDPLSKTLSNARKDGASVIVGKGELTGRTTSDLRWNQMALTSVRTLSGPTIHPVTLGWIDSNRGPAGPMEGTDAGSLWGTDGSLFAIVSPDTGESVKGPVLRIAPVVGGNVIFGPVNGCWDTRGLPTSPFRGPLASIPGSDAYARGVEAGLQAVPLSTVEKLAAAASR